jgi:hypothetical protein
MKFAPLFISTLLFFAAINGCVDEKLNENPIVRFIQPESSLMITNDTIIRFVIEAVDSDGKISKVELLINEQVEQTITDAPYSFDWYAKLENAGSYLIEAKAYDNKGGTASAGIQMEIYDYRLQFLGNFYFTIITRSWRLGIPDTYSTAFYDGLIRRYISIDSTDDLYTNDDSNEPAHEKITIEFRPKTKITTLLKPDGEFVEKYGYHYGHSGRFNHSDTVNFAVGGLGGLGGGTSYSVHGTRKKN